MKKYRILVIPRTGIGDLIQFTPALRYLVNSDLGEVSLLVHSNVQKQTIEGFSGIESIIEFDLVNYSTKKIFKLRNTIKEKFGTFDIVITAMGNNSGALGKVLNAREVIGFSDPRESLKDKILGRILFNKRIQMNFELNEVEEYYRLIKDFCSLEDQVELKKEISFDEILWKDLEEKFDLSNLMSPILVIQPGGDQPGKEWPIESFSKLSNEYHGSTIILGGAKEEEKAQAILRMSIDTSKIRNLVGKTNIKETMAIINEADHVVTNDNSCSQICGALNKKSVVIFGPTSEKRCAPWSNQCELLFNNELDCRPCYQHYSGDYSCHREEQYECTKSISPELVLSKLN